MAKIDRVTTVTLSAMEIAEAIKDYVEKMQGGDLPAMDVSSAVIVAAHDGGYGLHEKSEVTAVICSKQ